MTKSVWTNYFAQINENRWFYKLKEILHYIISDLIYHIIRSEKEQSYRVNSLVEYLSSMWFVELKLIPQVFSLKFLVP